MRVMHRLIAVFALSACACSGRARAMTELEACTAAFGHNDPAVTELCKRGWGSTHDIAAAVTSARDALIRNDYEALKAWAALAPDNLEGARILHFWGEMQGGRGDLDGAEKTLRKVLDLRRDVDPGRAANTAVTLLPIVRSRRPAKDSIELAYVAWEQAGRAGGRIVPMAATALTEVLLDLGELRAADKIAARIDQ